MWVKRDGKWLIDGVRESPVHVDDSSDAIDELGWLIGDWVAEGPQVSAEVSCSWGRGESYIVAQLKMQPVDQAPFSATQVSAGTLASKRSARSCSTRAAPSPKACG